MELLPIVFSTDHNFVMPTCVTIHSLLKHAQVAYDIFIIIDKDVSVSDKELLIKQVNIHNGDNKINFIEIGDTFSKGYEIRGISKACYNRLLIPWLIPQYDRIVYSDVDIIFKKDISEVYKIDLKSDLIAGVGGKTWTKGIIRNYLKKIGANPEEYINSGFLLINSKQQRDEALKERFLELSRKKFLYQDQDIINLVCKGRIFKLPPIYNVSPSNYSFIGNNEAKIIHFFGLKPWKYFTYSWQEWWYVYETSIVYSWEYAKKVSDKILNPAVFLEMKRKILIQKFKFLLKYLCH